MLPDATLLPQLDAALYRAAAKIPGVLVVTRAKDYTDRSGIGLSFKESSGHTVWVYDKSPLDFLGPADASRRPTAFRVNAPRTSA
ncbi:hypothetical protein ABZ848_48535 [Streptomyces sp. NPDC047081]|uniref:hypothetical protein n=1 Tax=Streptomyces sp. NPDC047081 TaxID=3154706 RepID=UPI0033E7BFD3